MRLGRKNKKTESIKTVQTVLRETRNNSPIFSRFAVQTRTERQLYTTLRESVPIIDAALCKIIRLIGGFKIVTSSAESQKIADSFVKNVRTNGEMMGLESFVLCYLDSLLTYGQAVGEIVPDSGGEGICALYNASLDDVEIRADSSPLKLAVYTLGNGTAEEPKHPERIFATLLNPKPGTVCGTSILSGLPFVSSILLRIFESVKTNWERVGDIRFAVTLNPDSNGSAVSRENAQAVAEYLSKNDKVAWVNYCGLPDNKYYELAQKYMPNGSCGVISFGLKGGREVSIKFMDSLQLVAIVTHVADARTCVLHPASHTHRQLSDEQLLEAGVRPDLIRLSVGIENVDDIIADIEQALNA